MNITPNLYTIFNDYIYTNNNAKIYMKQNTDRWDNFIITECYEGPQIKIYYNNQEEKWYILAEQMYINKNKTSLDLFTEIIKINRNDFLNLLDTRLCYTFVLLHHRYKNIVQYDSFKNDYKELVVQDLKQTIDIDIDISAVELSNHIEKLSSAINMNILTPTIYNFSCYDEFENTINKINHDNVVFKKVSTEGFIIKEIKPKFKTTYMKIQTDIYIQLKKIKSSFKNNYDLYLDLYQKNKLADILPYISKYNNEIIHRLNISMKTLSHEFLNIYHITRKKNNKNIYDILPDQYKKILYGIHGLYIKKRKYDFTNKNNSSDYVLKEFSINELDNMESKSITVHDIYHYMKSLPYEQLKQIYIDRNDLITNELLMPYLDCNCIYTLTQSKLLC